MQNAPSVATTTDSPALNELERATALEVEAKDQLEHLLEWNRQDAQSLDLHEVERGLFKRLIALGLTLLLCHLARRGIGKAGGDVLRDGVSLPYHSNLSRTYLSIFGKLKIERAYFWEAGQAGVCPLDAELNLPETRYSYFLQEFGELIGVNQAYDKLTDYLERLLGVSFWKQGAQKVAKQAGKNVQAFYEQKEAPPACEEGELLVATIDGKGVPMRREAPPKTLRPEKGPRINKKKEAVVSVVFTIDRNVRSAEDLLREIDKDNHVVPPVKDPPERPKPKHKRVRATMLGKDAAFEDVRRQFEERDPDGTKVRLALTDGDSALQDRALELAGPSGITLILDLLHVLTYVWAAAHAFHDEGSVEASRWVMGKLRLLLEGKVGYVIGGLRQSVKKRKLRGKKREAVEKAIGYMDRNREFMRYDEYLAKGYPVGSGVVEGACRHLVKDRMELGGMHWSKPGAQAILELRAVETNGDWNKFWRFHVGEESARLHGAITRRDSRGFESFPGRAVA